jgi:hypothetical protein
MEIDKRSRNVVVVQFPDILSGWEKWVFLSSDRHHDSAGCDRKLELEHLELCRERDASIIDVGDLYDAMQGRYDPRRSYPDMRPEYAQAMIKQGRCYLDLIVEDAAKFYAPYAGNFLVIGRGNHESSIQTHNDTDLTDRLVSELNKQPGATVQAGCYGGWVVFQFTMGKTQHERILLKYYHGSGGDAPVTRGVIQTARQAVYLPDADIVVNGHSHNAYIVPIERERMSMKCVSYQDTQWHLRTPTYHDDYGDGGDGWHVESGKPPKPRGGIWLHFTYLNKHIHFRPMLEIV